MQPLPPQVTTGVFTAAADHFNAAAAQVGTPAVPQLLTQAAHEVYQGIPSLRMTTARDQGAPLAAALTEAADAAMSLAKVVQDHPAGTSITGNPDTFRGWARLADNAAALVAPDPFGGSF